VTKLEAHIPVLYEEALAGLKIAPGSLYIDATAGGGGHSAGILERSGPDGRLLAIDADPEAIAHVREVLRPLGQRALCQVANFRQLSHTAQRHGFDQVAGVLMDLGLSSRQLDDAQRGFSFTREGPLDMRLDRNQEQMAADLVNHLPADELANLLWRYGEEKKSRPIARAVVEARPIESTAQLAEVVARVVGRRQKIHPATRTFQALRIAINDELAALEEALPQALSLLRPGGRLVVISFHSLEDGRVKRFFQHEARDCVCPPEVPVCVCQHRATLRIITRKPIRPTEAEIARNPRSRSARLRVAERLP
jgi:16S rRNA (cytosine1402-N4)-methyltransferase